MFPEITGKLANYKSQVHTSTEQTYYTGQIYDDSRHRFADGSVIRTSAVTEVFTVAGRTFIRTLNSVYELVDDQPAPFTDIMVDTETLSTAPNAHMLSLGILAFNLETGRVQDLENGFYGRFDPEYQVGRHIDYNTVSWWMDQSVEARNEVFSPIDEFISGHIIYDSWACKNAITHFIEKYTVGTENVRVWAKSPQFDLVKLGTFMEKYGNPWSFRNEQCVRTEIRGHDMSLLKREGVYHHALHDCKHQIREVLYVNGK